MIYMIYADKIW